MRYKIDDFTVVTEKSKEKLNDKIAVPTTIQDGRASKFVWDHKTREFTIFKQLNFFDKNKKKHYRVMNDLFDFIDLIEMLKAFNSNKLDTAKEYQISDKFTAKTAQKDGNMSLKIHFKNYSHSLFLDKFECSSLSAKFGKVLQRCEAWQEQEA